MKERTRKIFIMIVMAALIVSLMAASFAALTYGRYSGGRRDENSAYEDILDLVGETAFEVSTADELVNAINNGYSYIKVVGDDPTLVVNNDVADVIVNLVLDVNGHKIVRNSRNPLLNVRQSVSVVLVYDSSEKAQGGFYNPVGSALQTSGGTLTVGEGVYESGPSKEATQSQGDGTVSATVCSRDNNRKATSYSVQSTAQTFPKLTKKTGDVYLTADTSNSYLKADTYLIYTEEENAFVGDGNGSGKFEDGQLYVNRKETSSGETTTITADKFSPICDVASCDFYYYYPVGTAGTANSPQTYAVVYGYNEVKGLAKTEDTNLTSGNETNLVWPYAAIRSEAGNTHARGGEFYTYFGEENTYSIYSEGGTMTVGLSGESDPPKFQAIGKGVCINMAGTSGNADQTLTIENGEFSSKIGDTIKMSGGEMEVKKGSFTKDATGADENSTNNGSAISISGGTLNSSDTEDTSKPKPIQFHITGSHVNGIYAKGGEVNIANATFVFENGKNNQGVYNDGGTSRAHWCDFTIPGNNNYGIHSTNGTTRASDCNITMTGDYVVGVYTTGGRALVEGGSINVGFAGGKSDKLLTSAAVSTEGGEIYLAGELTINSASLGVTVRKVEETEGSLEIADQEIKIENTTYKVVKGDVTINTPNATGIYINNGSLTNKGTVTVTSCVEEDGADKGWSWVDENGSAIQDFNKYNGVYVQGGSLVSEGTLNVTFTGVENENSGTYLDQQIKSYAVRVEAAASGRKTEVSIAGGEISNSVGGGVYVGGGTVTLGVKNGNKGPTVQTTGKLLYTSWLEVVGGSWKYMLNKSGGHAVEVSGGSLTVHGGNYTSQQGNGILIRNTADVKTTNTVTIEDGSFVGYNSGYYIEYDGQTPLGGDRMVGPAASYGLNVMGHDLDVRINGGEFGNNEGDVGNSAASFFGTPDGSRPQVAVHGGTFNANNADAISVFRFIDITFDGTASKISSNISNGAVASLSVQNDLLYTGESDRGSTIEIQSGTFTGTAYGIWYACGYDKLSISGDATIKGPTGLQVASAPVENGIAISGGTIRGYVDGIFYGSSAVINDNGYGLTISGGIIEGTGTASDHAHALRINAEPRANAISISGGEFYGGRDAIYVANEGGEENAVSITGGTFTGAVKDEEGSNDYGCALWFADNIDSGVFVISGGTFISKGGAIATPNPRVYYLRRILRDDCLLIDKDNNQYDGNNSFYAIEDESEITVRRS